MADQTRPKGKPRHCQLDEMIPKRAKIVEPARHKVEGSAERVRNGLRFIMIIEACQVAPAGVAANFNQPCPKHDAKSQPAKQPNDQRRRRPAWKGPSVQQWTQKDGQKPRFQTLHFPTIRKPVLPNLDTDK